jgi:hypothetical protein
MRPDPEMIPVVIDTARTLKGGRARRRHSDSWTPTEEYGSHLAGTVGLPRLSIPLRSIRMSASRDPNSLNLRAEVE